jgi:hypothetical protein
MLLASALLALVAPVPLLAGGQTPADAGTAPPDRTDGRARELWDAACRATLLRPSRQASPVTAFDLNLEVLTRGNTGSQEFRPRLRWLAPGYLRFEISKNLEQGLGPEGYWLREDDEAPISLDERAYEEDRAQINQLLVVVRNFVALTNPGELDVRRLELLDDPPAELRRGHLLARGRMRRRLDWIELESPDFQLPTETAADPWSVAPTAEVALGIDRETSLPIVAVVREKGSPTLPIVLYLEDHRALDDLRVPHQVWVYGFEPGESGPELAEKPGQQMHVIGGTVRAKLTPTSFLPPR